VLSKKIVFRKKWFDLFEIKDEITNSNFYGIKPPDYVTAVAFNNDGMILLVMQRRPVIDKNNSLETPGGTVDKGDTPLESIKKELLEELGMSFKNVNNICILEPDVGRLMNKLYVFKAENPEQIRDPEKGIKIIKIKPKDVFNLIDKKELTNAYSISALSIVLRSIK
tara:strand:+ start:77 stop:577 length:501 start_codon:yes stop_codon:yes gene_type:complete